MILIVETHPIHYDIFKRLEFLYDPEAATVHYRVVWNTGNGYQQIVFQDGEFAQADTTYKGISLDGPCNTLVEYLYRDGSNYKVRNTAVVKGLLSEAQVKDIFDACNGADYWFIPSQVGLPETRFGAVTDDDIPWFELQELKPTDKKQTAGIAAQQLHGNFLAAKDHWDETIWQA